MQRRQLPQTQGTQPYDQEQRIFTASEVAEYEYCPLVWWYEKYEPLVAYDSEELFAHLVELEEEHGPQATTLPEYQVVEQLLVRRGAFEVGEQQHRAHAEAVAEIGDPGEIAEERLDRQTLSAGARQRLGRLVAIIVVLAVILIVIALLLGVH